MDKEGEGGRQRSEWRVREKGYRGVAAGKISESVKVEKCMVQGDESFEGVQETVK